MEDWLPSERSQTIKAGAAHPGPARLRPAGPEPAPVGSARPEPARAEATRPEPARGPAGGGVATREPTGTGGRPRLTEALTSRMGSRPRPQPAARPTQRVIRRDLMVRRVDPWTVLKISLVFYSCLLVVVMLANAVLWAFIARIGLIETVTDVAGDLNIALAINTGNILQSTFLLGVLAVIFWSAVNVFLAFLYNLIADLIGGIRIDLAEDE